MRIKIVAVGKIRERWISEGIEEYAKRVKNLEIVEVKDGKNETDDILRHIKNEDVIVMTEEGEENDSKGFATFLKTCENDICLIIGGPDGVSEKLKKIATKKLSMSRMTFTHEMARLFLVEQIYRAQSINQNKKYHR